MPAYNKFVVYYFSGTGNSKNVALWLSVIAKENNIETQIINITQIDRLSIKQPEPNILVAFVSPIHGFNYPPIMLHFIMRFPKGKNNVLLLNTRAGMLIGKFITPGLTGIAFYLSSFILKLKGYSIKAMYPIDLPSNWVSLHPGLNKKTVDYLYKKNKERVTIFAYKVFAGKKVFKGLYEIIQDILVLPISIMYYLAGRFFLAKTFYASHDCDNCGICIKGCPVKAIIKKDNRLYWTFNCESCMKCMGNCPRKAIETAHGFIIVFLLVSAFLWGFFYKYFEVIFFEVDNDILKLIVKTIFYLLFLGLFYRIIHYAMRVKFIERLMVFTSLTKFKFWGPKYKASNES